MGIMSLNKLKNKKSKKNIRKTFRGKRKIGGNNLCMYSNNMDNSANGVYGFHPLWNKNYCSNSNLYESGNDNKAKVMKLLGGNKKKTVKRKKIRSKSIKNLQKGGEYPESSKNIDEATERLKAELDKDQGEHALEIIESLQRNEQEIQHHPYEDEGTQDLVNEGDGSFDEGAGETSEEVDENVYDAFADDEETD